MRARRTLTRIKTDKTCSAMKLEHIRSRSGPNPLKTYADLDVLERNGIREPTGIGVGRWRTRGDAEHMAGSITRCSSIRTVWHLKLG